MKKASFLGLGTPVMDFFFRVDEYKLVELGLKKGSSNFVDNQTFEMIRQVMEEKPIEERPGDNARNMCESFARLAKNEGDSVYFCGTIADDDVGIKIESAGYENGYQNLLQKKPGHSGKIMCLITTDKQRTFVVFLGVSEDMYDVSLLPEAHYIYISSISALSSGNISKSCKNLIYGRSKDTKFVFSFESPAMIEENQEAVKKLAMQADILFLNEDEMIAAGLNELKLKELCPLVYLKLGKDGAKIIKKGMVAHVPTLPVEDVVDTTGAGDTFAAAVIWALWRGMNEIDAAKVGHKAAAATICKVGNSIPKDFVL
jgi:sugar/nucleoside kinase (ribokinase family)